MIRSRVGTIAQVQHAPAAQSLLMIFRCIFHTEKSDCSEHVESLGTPLRSIRLLLAKEVTQDGELASRHMNGALG